MKVRTKRVEFKNENGETLVGRLECPLGTIRSYAIFAHCFTCSKDVHAATRISRGLGSDGIAVLRFDFTGLGGSGGDFANSNFSSNISDLISAANFLSENYQAPELLVGHSLGGAAVLVAASQIPSVKIVSTIGAPSDPGHVSYLFEDQVEEIKDKGCVEVELAGRSFQICKQFLDDISESNLKQALKESRFGLLVFHSPTDDVVGIEHAKSIYESAKHPKSFVSLEGADHFLSNPEDSEFVSRMLSSWAERYVTPSKSKSLEREGVIFREVDQNFFLEGVAQGHPIFADEPTEVGGTDVAPSPYGFLSAALAACKLMTLRLYFKKKNISVDEMEIKVTHKKNDSNQDQFNCQIDFPEEMDETVRERALEISKKCPVHKTLESGSEIRTLSEM